MPAKGGLHSNPEKDRELAERDAEVVRLKTEESLTFQQIATKLGLSVGGVYAAYQRALTRIVQPSVEAYREAQLAQINAMRQGIFEIFHAKHVVVQHGHVVEMKITRENGETISFPLPDSGPMLAAADRLIKLNEQEAKLLGMYPDKKVSVSGDVRYEIIGVSAADLV